MSNILRTFDEQSGDITWNDDDRALRRWATETVFQLTYRGGARAPRRSCVLDWPGAHSQGADIDELQADLHEVVDVHSIQAA